MSDKMVYSLLGGTFAFICLATFASWGAPSPEKNPPSIREESQQQSQQSSRHRRYFLGGGIHHGK